METKRKIVGVIRPFLKHQIFMVYENGEKLETFEIELKDMSSEILAHAEKYNLNTVDLVGPKQYIRGLIKQMQEKEMQQYNKHIINYNIL